jgi:hypothetical protein
MINTHTHTQDEVAVECENIIQIGRNINNNWKGNMYAYILWCANKSWMKKKQNERTRE